MTLFGIEREAFTGLDDPFAQQRFYDDERAAVRFRVLSRINPYMAQRPDALVNLASSNMTPEQLVNFGAQTYGMQTADTIRQQLERMGEAEARSLYSQLSPAQQMTLTQSGYKPPERDENRWYEPLANVIGAGLGGAVNVVQNTADFLQLDKALDAMIWLGDQPAHLYRTIRTMDDASQWAALVGGVILGGAAIAASPFTGGASLGALAGAGSLMTAGFIGSSALVGASVAAAATGPADWYNAWSASFDGERTFDRAAVQRAETILGDPRLVNMARAVADELGDTEAVYGLAVDLVGQRDPTRQSQIEALSEVAARYATPDTPEYQRVIDGLYNLIELPQFQEAVTTLQNGKISFGRDVADVLLPGGPDSTLYSFMSGAIDAAWAFAMDPLLIGSEVMKARSFAVRGMPPLDGPGAEMKFLDISRNHAGVRAQHEAIAKAVNDYDAQAMKRLAPTMREQWLDLLDYRRLVKGETGEFTVDDFREWMTGVHHLTPLAEGFGTVRGMPNGTVLSALNWNNRAWRAVADPMRAFTTGLTDPKAEKWMLDAIKKVAAESGDNAVLRLFPDHIIYANDDAMVFHGLRAEKSKARSELDNLLNNDGAADEIDTLRQKIDRLDAEINEAAVRLEPTITSADDITPELLRSLALKHEPSPWARLAGRWTGQLLGRAGDGFGQLVTRMTTMVPEGSALHLHGPQAFDDVTRFTELAGMLGMPGWLRKEWANAILYNGSPGLRANAVLTFMDNMLTIGGVRELPGGGAALNEYLTRARMAYAGGGQDSLILDGIPTKATLFLSETADAVHMPNLTELRKAVKHGMTAHLIGLGDYARLEAFQNKVWKPAVVFRLGFIPRAGGEELLNYMLRGGFGSWTQEMGALSIARSDAWRAVNALVEKHGIDSLDEGARRIYEAGEMTFGLRHLTRQLGNWDYTAPISRHLKTYADWWRNTLRDGLGWEGRADAFLSRLAGREVELYPKADQALMASRTAGALVGDAPITRAVRYGVGTAAQRRWNMAKNVESLMFGNPYSWRRMIVGGVHDDLIEAGNKFYSRHSAALLRAVSANAGAAPVEFGHVPGNQMQIRADDGPDGEVRWDTVVPVQNERSLLGPDDPLFHVAAHGEAIRIFADDGTAVPVSEALLRMRPPKGIDVEDVVDFIGPVAAPPSPGIDLLMQWFASPNLDATKWRAIVRQLEADEDQELSPFIGLAKVIRGLVPDHDLSRGNIAGAVRHYASTLDVSTNWVDESGELVEDFGLAPQLMSIEKLVGWFDEWAPRLDDMTSHQLGYMTAAAAAARRPKVRAAWKQDIEARRLNDLRQQGYEREVAARELALSTPVTRRMTEAERLATWEDDVARVQLDLERARASATEWKDGPIRADLEAQGRTSDLFKTDAAYENRVRQLEAELEEMGEAERRGLTKGQWDGIRQRQAELRQQHAGWVNTVDIAQATISESIAAEMFRLREQNDLDGLRAAQTRLDEQMDRLRIRRQELDDELEQGLANIAVDPDGWDVVLPPPDLPEVARPEVAASPLLSSFQEMSEHAVAALVRKSYDAEQLQLAGRSQRVRTAVDDADRAIAGPMAGIIKYENMTQAYAVSYRTSKPLDVQGWRTLAGEAAAEGNFAVARWAERMGDYVRRGQAPPKMGFSSPAIAADAERLLARALSKVDPQAMVGSDAYLIPSIAVVKDQTALEVVAKHDGVTVWELPDGAKVAPDTGADQLYRDFEDLAKKQMAFFRTTATKSAQPRRVPKTRLLDDGTQESVVFENVTGGLVPVDPTRHLTQTRVQYYNSAGKPITLGDDRYFDNVIDEAAGEPEVAWGVVGPMIADVFDRRMGRQLWTDQEELVAVGHVRIPAGTRRPLTRSSYLDVAANLDRMPDLAVGRVYRNVKRNRWNDMVRFGYDKIIGPGLDSIARRPMAFHFFAARYIQNKARLEWLRDPALVDAMSAIHYRLRTEQDPEDIKQLAYYARTLGRWSSGEELQQTARWSDAHALAWLRGHGERELGELLPVAASRADLELAAGKLTESQHKQITIALMQLGRRNHSELLAALPEEMGADDFLAFARSALGDDGADLLTALGRGEKVPKEAATLIANHPLLSKLTDDEWQLLARAQKNYQQVVDHVADTAVVAAINDMMPFIDSSDFKTQFAEYGKNFLPFWYAEENFLKRWARTIALEGPAVIRKLQLTYLGLRSMGVVRTDENGKDWFVYPGSQLLPEILERVPGFDQLPVGVMFQTPTDMLLPGMNARFGTPQVGPMVSVPLDVLTMMMPELSTMERQIVGDLSASRNVLQQLVPATVLNTFEAILADDGVARFSSAQLSAMMQLDAAGQGLPADASDDDIDDWLRKVRNHARVILLSQALAGWVAPGPVIQLNTGKDAQLNPLNIEDPGAILSNVYVEMVRDLGIEAGTLRFKEIYPDIDVGEMVVNPLAYTVAKNESVSGAPLPATELALQFFDANSDYMAEFPNAGPWLLPQDPAASDAHSQYAYDQQTISGLRRRRSPEEFLRALKFKEGSQVYFTVRQEYFDQIEQARVSGANAQAVALRRRWEGWASAFKATHPVFARELEGSESRERRRLVLSEMRTVVNDPAAPDTPHFAQLQEMVRLYDTYLLTKAQMSQDSSVRGRAAVEQLKGEYETRMNQLVTEWPATRSFWLSVLRPESQLD